MEKKKVRYVFAENGELVKHSESVCSPKSINTSSSDIDNTSRKRDQV